MGNRFAAALLLTFNRETGQALLTSKGRLLFNRQQSSKIRGEMRNVAG
jgi:hypothetical protein